MAGRTRVQGDGNEFLDPGFVEIGERRSSSGGFGGRRFREGDGPTGNEVMKVACRIRPAQREEPRVWVVSGKTVAAIPPPLDRGGHHHAVRRNAHSLPSFTFDQAFGEDSTNIEVYQQFCKQVVHRAIEGCKSTLMLYGQTGAGKTHTVSGTKAEAGVFTYAIRDILAAGKACESGKFSCSFSVVAVYNERVMDMLNPSGPEPLEMLGKELRDKNRQPATKVEFSSEEEAQELFHLAEKQRKYAETQKNTRSSRSHTVFIIDVKRTTTEWEDDMRADVGGRRAGTVERGEGVGGEGIQQQSSMGGKDRLLNGALRSMRRGVQKRSDGREGEKERVLVTTKGTLYLVDLAGSESTKESGATGLKKRETEIINKSLLALTEVLGHLSRGSSPDLAPYRRSMLTRVLRPCLGGTGTDEKGAVGDSFAAMMFCIDPLNLRVSEKTLKYGLITKAIRIQYGIHMVREKGDEETSSQLAQLQKEIEQLKEENARLERQRMALLLIWRRGWRQWMPNNGNQRSSENKVSVQGSAALPPRPKKINIFRTQGMFAKEQMEVGKAGEFTVDRKSLLPPITRIQCLTPAAIDVLAEGLDDGRVPEAEEFEEGQNPTSPRIDFHFSDSDWETEVGVFSEDEGNALEEKKETVGGGERIKYGGRHHRCEVPSKKSLWRCMPCFASHEHVHPNEEPGLEGTENI